MIFKTVLPGEGGLALVTFEGLLSRVTPVVVQQTAEGCEGL